MGARAVLRVCSNRENNIWLTDCMRGSCLASVGSSLRTSRSQAGAWERVRRVLVSWQSEHVAWTRQQVLTTLTAGARCESRRANSRRGRRPIETARKRPIRCAIADCESCGNLQKTGVVRVAHPPSSESHSKMNRLETCRHPTVRHPPRRQARSEVRPHTSAGSQRRPSVRSQARPNCPIHLGK